MGLGDFGFGLCFVTFYVRLENLFIQALDILHKSTTFILKSQI